MNRIEELERKLKAREGNSLYADSVKDIKAEIARLKEQDNV